MLTVRIRSRDGLERVDVTDNATVHDLREAIQEKLGVPYHDQQLSKDQGLLRAAARPSDFKDMINDRATLRSLGVTHGALIFLRYSVDREVQPVARPSAPATKMDIATLSARWARIERPKEGVCSAVSFDGRAVAQFEAYVSGYLAFTVKRGGIMYGTFGEDGAVHVEAIYEPPQHGSGLSLAIEEDVGEQHVVDTLATSMGLQKVGWIFSQTVAEREHVLSAEEVVQMARWQRACGGRGASAVVSLWEEEDGRTQVHVEAYCVSKQLEDLVADGWVTDAPPESNVLRMRNPKAPEDATPLIVASKSVGEVDVEWFLLTVPIKDHTGTLRTEFPIENRMIPQTSSDLKRCLGGPASMTYQQRMRDFHLLLWLARQGVLDAETDMPLIVAALMRGEPIMEGYKLMIDSLAGS